MSGGGGSGGGDEDEDEAWDAMVNEARALVSKLRNPQQQQQQPHQRKGDEEEEEEEEQQQHERLLVAALEEVTARVAADEEFVAVGLALTPGGVILGTLSYTDIPAVINCN
jgi:hypothetical protein